MLTPLCRIRGPKGPSPGAEVEGELGSPRGGEAFLVLPSETIEDTGHSALATFIQRNGEECGPVWGLPPIPTRALGKWPESLQS